MPEEPLTIGILGTSPSGHPGPVRAARFDAFQRLVGELESAPTGGYHAGHAACHSLMNGVPRVAFCGVSDPRDGAALVDAFHRLVAEGPAALVVAPGAIASAAPLRDAFLAWEASERLAGRSRPGDVSLWLDAPDGATLKDVIAYQADVSPDPELIRVVYPWVPTISPARRAYERIPGTCLAGPLYLGVAQHLRGVHELGRHSPVAELDLRDAGCALLTMTHKRRRIVKLDFPPPRGAGSAPEVPTSLEGRIREALHEALIDLVAGQPSGPGLWKSVERDARSVLDRFVRSAEISSFVLRCDEETNLHLHGGLGLEVLIKVPQRVRNMIINVSVRTG